MKQPPLSSGLQNFIAWNPSSHTVYSLAIIIPIPVLMVHYLPEHKGSILKTQGNKVAVGSHGTVSPPHQQPIFGCCLKPHEGIRTGSWHPEKRGGEGRREVKKSLIKCISPVTSVLHEHHLACQPWARGLWVSISEHYHLPGVFT